MVRGFTVLNLAHPRPQTLDPKSSAARSGRGEQQLDSLPVVTRAGRGDERPNLRGG